MNATKKSYSLINGVYTEGVNKELPGLEWSDINGNIFRAIALDLQCDLIGNSIKSAVLVEIKAVGRTSWNREQVIVVKADNTEFRDLTTGLKCEPIFVDGVLDSNIVTNFAFFVRIFGHNVDNVSASIYTHIVNGIADEFDLTIVE
jgi:hypothetical protein